MLPLLLLGCDPWDLPDGGYQYLESTWDPVVVPASDGVYVRLPHAGRLVRVKPDGTWAQVDLDGATPEKLIPTDNGNGLFVVASWPVCDDDDPLIVNVDDCPNSKLSTEYEVALVQDGQRVGNAALDGVAPQINAAVYSHDGETAALYLDYNGEEIVVDGFVNLNEVAFVNLGDGSVNRVAVGFAPETILFTSDDKRAVILSRSQVAVVNLGSAGEDCEAWDVCVTYPLTLDADQAVVPNNVVLVADGNYALVSITSKKDVYVLDLVNESIDLLELDSVPSAMAVDEANDRTVFVYDSAARIDVVEHEFFEVSSFTTDEPATSVVATSVGMLAYNDQNYHDVVTFDAATGDWHEQRAENPVMELLVAEHYAVATMRPDNYTTGSGTSAFYDENYGFGIFPLAPVTGDDPRDAVALVLESEPVGLALSADDKGEYALLLLDGVDTLLKVNLDTASADEISLEAPPIGISSSPDGRFIVTGDTGVGMLSFVDPADNGVVTVAGFATSGLASPAVLPRREEKE